MFELHSSADQQKQSMKEDTSLDSLVNKLRDLNHSSQRKDVLKTNADMCKTCWRYSYDESAVDLLSSCVCARARPF